MFKIEATIPAVQPPAWALWQRKLIDIMNQAVYPFLQKYTREDGSIIWRETWPATRDGVDDFYESFFNWPLLYLLGGGDHLLELAQREWEGVTQQLSVMGALRDEYERGYDQFHQSESQIFFYFLCLADPTNPKWIARAQRFAELFTKPDAGNYDPEHKIIRAPHNGSDGARWGIGDGEPYYGYYKGMEPYGLPYDDLPGITRYEDLQDPAKARQMGEAMHERMGKGDVAQNLFATSLVTNAWLLTGDEAYQAWVLEYVEAWFARASDEGLLPDNVGLSGVVGEYMNGRWYGGLYGWEWPHGFYNINYAAVVAATNAFLMTRNPGYFDVPRRQTDTILNLGKQVTVESIRETSLFHHFVGVHHALDGSDQIFVIPYRYQTSGWFDYQPVTLPQPVGIWNVTMDESDWQRITAIREKSGYDWRKVVSFRDKGDQSHEEPWLCFIKGENPNYPEQMLAATYAQVCRRLEQIRQDTVDLTTIHIHHWQQLNPVITEVLVQLTLGAPQVLYYGGMLITPVRYFDADRQRPGLPEDVAALVDKMDANGLRLRLVNLSAFEARGVIIQAGGLGEHHFEAVRYTARVSDYPGAVGDYAAPDLVTEQREAAVDARHLHVQLPPATEITLNLRYARFVHTPSYQTSPFV